MFGIGMTELLVILVVALLVFGPTKLPELARSLGRAMHEFRRASNDLRASFNEAVDPGQPPPPPRPAPTIAAPAKPGPIDQPDQPGAAAASAADGDAPASAPSAEPAASEPAAPDSAERPPSASAHG